MDEVKARQKRHDFKRRARDMGVPTAAAATRLARGPPSVCWNSDAGYSLGVMGGDPQLDHSRTELRSTGSRPVLLRSSRPENMGFMGACRTSKLLGLPDVESGGVAGRYW